MNRHVEKGCLMAMVEPTYGPHIVRIGKTAIPPEILYTDPNDPTYGYDEEPHVTLKYGFLPDLQRKDVATILKGVKPFNIILKALSQFNNENYDVVKFDVDKNNQQLMELRNRCDRLPNEDLVGFQTTQGGGLTNTNFIWNYGAVEKIDKDYQSGVFSNPITLNDLNVNILEAKEALSKDLKVYPSYDLTEVTNFTLYGSLTKRFSASIAQIINFFPAAIEVDQVYFDYSTANTATNIVYNQNENTTSFDVDVERIKNIFDIDFSQNAARNIALRPTPVSPLRDMTTFFRDYSLFIGTGSTEYQFILFTASNSTTSGTLSITVSGNPFSGVSTTTKTLVMRPNKLKTEMVFNNDFDEVQKFLLNRFVVPKYTAQFKLPQQTDDGTFYTSYVYLTWPLLGVWNLDIITTAYDSYLETLSSYGEQLDAFKTNLISRFLTTDAFHEFDTKDQKVEKVLQIYGRSFDETKIFIDSLATMTSVEYVPENDIPSALLVYLAKTLGWDTNIKGK